MNADWMSNESLTSCSAANSHRYIYAEEQLGWLGAIKPMAHVQFSAVLWHQYVHQHACNDF